jgi:hypothetical protein
VAQAHAAGWRAARLWSGSGFGLGFGLGLASGFGLGFRLGFRLGLIELGLRLGSGSE